VGGSKRAGRLAGRGRFGSLMLVVGCVAAFLTGCSETGSPAPLGPAPVDNSPGGGARTTPDSGPVTTTGSWLDAPGKVQFYNYLVDNGKEITVDLYWFKEEIVDKIDIVQRTEKFATLKYGEKTEVIPSRHYGKAGVELEEVEYLAVPTGTTVAGEAANKDVVDDIKPMLKTDLYHSNSDAPTDYLNGGGTVVVFLSPATNGTIEARPRVQSFYADLYPSGVVNFPPPESEIPKAGPGEVVLPVGFLFGTESRTESGKLANLAEWRWSADGECLAEEGSNSYGGDGERWMHVVSDSAEITIHADFDYSGCTEPAWQDPVSLQGIARPFGLIVPTASGEPTMQIIDIPE
jgi:hypothetical protein